MADFENPYEISLEKTLNWEGFGDKQKALEAIKERFNRFNQENIPAYRSGERDLLETGLGAIRHTAGGIGDAFFHLTPDLGLSKALSEFDNVRGAASYLENLEKENPREFNNAAGLLAIPSLLGGSSLVKSIMTNTPKAAAAVVSQPSNRVSSFYSGMFGGEIGGIAKNFGKSIVDTAQQFYTAKGNALLDKRLPVHLVKLAEKSFDDLEQIHKAADVKREAIKKLQLPAKDKARLLSEIDEEVKTQAVPISKTLMGQVQHDYFTRKQYGIEPSDIVKKGTSSTNLATAPFTAETFKELFPDLPDHLLPLLAKRWNINPDGSAILVARNPTAGAGAAGIVQRDVHKLSKVDKGVKQTFSQQPLVNNFKSADAFFKGLDKGKITEALRNRLSDEGFLSDFYKAFNKKDSPLKKATTLDEFQEALKQSGIKMNKDDIKLAFNRAERQPFNNVEELMAALEKQGVTIPKASREAALQRGFVTLQDSMVSKAIDLGGTGQYHVVYPNGKKITVVSDGYDLWDQVAPGQQKLLNVAPYTEELLGKKKSADNVLGVLKSAEKVELDQPSPFVFGTNEQKQMFQQLKDAANIEPTITDSAKAFRNKLMTGNVLANPILHGE